MGRHTKKMNLVNMHKTPRFIVLFFIIRLCVFFGGALPGSPRDPKQGKSTKSTVANHGSWSLGGKGHPETPRVTMTPMRTQMKVTHSSVFQSHGLQNDLPWELVL